MVNISNPTPGADLGIWGSKLNVVTETLSAAIDEVAADASDAQTAATTAVTSAAAAQSSADAASVAAAAANAAASGAAASASSVSATLTSHTTGADPHTQYLTQAKGDARYVRSVGASDSGASTAPVLQGTGNSAGVTFSLAASPYGIRADGTTYYNADGVTATERAYPVVQVDGTVKLVKIRTNVDTNPDVIPPVISAVSSGTPLSTSATVTFSTNELATAVIEYGTTTAYGSQASSATLNTSHSVTLNGLTASTTYHYRIRATDQAGNVTTDSDRTLATAAGEAAPQTAATFTTSTTLNWAFQMFGADAASANHWVEADVSGLTNSNRNAGFILRGNSGGTAGILLVLSGTQYKIEHVSPSTNILSPVPWTGAGGGSGKMRAEIIGTNVVIYWNGTLVASHDLGSAISAYASNLRPGVGIYQDTAGAVTVANPKASASSSSSPPPNQDPGTTPPASGQPGAKAQAMFGPTRSGLPWHSGAWYTSQMSTSNANSFGTWRGSPLDFYTVYPAYQSWSDMQSSSWVFQLTSGFAGKLNYGLPMLPVNRAGQWADVTGGSQDETFRGIARDMVANNRGDSMIRVGLECNGNWFPWSVTWSGNETFKTAFRRIVDLMRAIAPNLKFAYCWNVASLPQGMPSGTSPQAQLERFYPGDGYVDAIELDFYDFYQVIVQSEAQWTYAKRPSPGVGLDDIADYARLKGKGVWIGEWGCHSVQGPGDNPFFVQKVWSWMTANADILIGENYFDEPASYIANSIKDQLPNAGTAYKNRWGHPEAYPNGI